MAIPEQEYLITIKVTINTVDSHNNEESFWYLKIKVDHYDPSSVFGGQINRDHDLIDYSYERPFLEISDISQSGLVTIQFSETLIVPPNAQVMIDSRVLELALTPQNEAFTP